MGSLFQTLTSLCFVFHSLRDFYLLFGLLLTYVWRSMIIWLDAIDSDHAKCQKSYTNNFYKIQLIYVFTPRIKSGAGRGKPPRSPRIAFLISRTDQRTNSCRDGQAWWTDLLGRFGDFNEIDFVDDWADDRACRRCRRQTKQLGPTKHIRSHGKIALRAHCSTLRSSGNGKTHNLILRRQRRYLTRN